MKTIKASGVPFVSSRTDGETISDGVWITDVLIARHHEEYPLWDWQDNATEYAEIARRIEHKARTLASALKIARNALFIENEQYRLSTDDHQSPLDYAIEEADTALNEFKVENFL